MICAYCKTTRVENEAPCPNCGAPSPLQGMPQNSNRAALWQWEQSSSFQQSGNAVQQPQSGFWGVQPGAAQPPQMSQMQNIPREQQENLLLPVPYQGSTGLQQVPQQAAPTQLVPAQNIARAAQMVPLEEGMVYVPPMYTKPRAIIPRYRAISGFLSIIIVTLMMCTGAGYYAKASGKLDLVSRVLTGGNPPPASLRPTAVSLPNPPDRVDKGPAYLLIPSATTTLHLLPGTSTASQTDQVFKPGEPFFLTYSVHPQTKGTVNIKWYTGNTLYDTVPIDIKEGGVTSGHIERAYPEPTEGMVELYWGNQLAQRLFFVVRN